MRLKLDPLNRELVLPIGKKAIVCISYVMRVITVLIIFSGGFSIASAYAGPPSDFKLNSLTWAHFSSGIRSYNFVDVYQCALYLPDRDQLNADNLVASIKTLEHPVAIRIKILTSMLPDTMPDIWRETIESEVTGKAFKRFRKGFAGLDEGDVLLFVYFPGKSTHVYLNDELQFKDPGPGLMQGLFDQWMGAQPISEDLKQALIGE